MFKTLKKVKILFVALIFILFFVFALSRGHIYDKNELEYGVTFSKKQIDNLGLDWQEAYLSILDELGVKKIRLNAYWDEVESEEGMFRWDDLDWQIREASNRGAEIILAVGERLPRWPECHIPKWANNLTKEEKNKKAFNYIEEVINRYKNNRKIVAWQVENEPFLPYFGECLPLDKEFLDKEISLVRELDSRPIIITDSGELSFWIPAAKRADIFGTTMYRDTYSAHLERYVHYPIAPGFFRFKKNIVKLFAKPDNWIVIELAAEPWTPTSYWQTSREERDKTMNLKKFREMLEFSSQTGFKEFYLWGAEWWYWEKVVNNDPAMWNEAGKLFK